MAGIPTGRYRFKVKAFLLESPDKYDLRTIEVVVPPYFLLSQGAIWIYIFLAALIGIILMFWRQTYLAKKYGADIKSELQEKLMNTRRGIRDYFIRRKDTTQQPSPVAEEEQTDDYEVIEEEVER